MIGIKLVNHEFYNEAEDIIRMFFGKCEILRLDEALAKSQSFLPEDAILLTSRVELKNGCCTCISEYKQGGKHNTSSEIGYVEQEDKKALKRLVKKSMYKLLSVVTDKEFPWGILTGIRPVKIVHEYINNGMAMEDIPESFMKEYMASEDRATLAAEIARIERPFIFPYDDNVISIYVGIPFCPTRCHYCSFTSNSITGFRKLVEPYLDSLMGEIRETAGYLKRTGYRVQSIYIGGGTPTSLEADQLDRLLKCIEQSFGNQAVEFTCEAGRPDSITMDKLRVLKENKITRISINPQSMNNEALKRIGRAHDASQIVDSFVQARAAGFDNINMDIILGLPGESIEQLAYTMEEIKKLDPESVTVHTMAIKRASVYNEELGSSGIADDEHVSAMMEYAKSFLRQ
ncbi:MAG: coproporphyrinogen dehydrogenase HemZ, partial [Pseudomonadota bacterium]